tara:strand:+ start:346 stop:870 length:525 start_codon:yes stop_codon:yes gene_type:complete
MDTQPNKKIYGVYIKSVLTNKVTLSITEVGNNLKQNLEKVIQHNNEGKCTPEGFIKPNSVKIISYSSGNVHNEYIIFQVVYECMVCYPVEGMLIEPVVKTITKAGIHAEIIEEDGTIPVTVFVSRDHHSNDKRFSQIKIGDKMLVSVIGSRFELNDKFISVIANLVYDTNFKKK